ncbi:MAG: HAD family phosphatase [Clostridia bacterium]|nr:HAD family phosphatase [Clostridia bacterium]
MKIKNVVFDYGQVMIHFKPAYMVGRYVSDPADARLLEEVIFDRLYWDDLDKNAISDEAVMAACRQRLPQRLWEVADTIYYNWIYNIPPVEGMEELVVYLRQQYGVGLYLLSNISTYFADHAEEMPSVGVFDRCVLSGPLGIVKPDRAIFAHLCDTCGLIPEETLFIDDSPLNLAGAKAYGIHGYQFDGDVRKLKAYLDEVLG